MGPVSLQKLFMQPFIKLEVDRVMEAGYNDWGYREISSQSFGDPNAKVHIVLVATQHQTGVVDSLLFSTVRSVPASNCVIFCCHLHIFDTFHVHRGFQCLII